VFQQTQKIFILEIRRKEKEKRKKEKKTYREILSYKSVKSQFIANVYV